MYDSILSKVLGPLFALLELWCGVSFSRFRIYEGCFPSGTLTSLRDVAKGTFIACLQNGEEFVQEWRLPVGWCGSEI